MRKTNIIYILLLIAIVCTLTALPFIQVPISISAPGVIRPQTENSKIISLVSGRVVESRILGNNQKVMAGDTLFVIVSKDLQNKLELNQHLGSEYAQQIADLTLLLSRNYKGLQSGLYYMELVSMQHRMSEVQSQLTLAKRELDRNELLFNQGIIAQAEFDKSRYSYEQLENQVSSIEKQQMAQWSAKLIELKQKHQSTSSERNAIQIDGENYIVRAPLTGTVINLKGFQKGSQIIQGQDILEISPEDNLVAECMVPANAIGYIKDKQVVKFQMDTYNYNQWGFLTGSVKDIDYNLVSDQKNTAFFKVRCQMDANFLSLPNGNKVTVGKGNTFNARFYLVDRTLWQLLFDRADDLFNPNLGSKES
ncbi:MULTISPECIES: HlyD family secretion protein [unclassified Sphingobacterium]|uniref:HlyD family secretion protein n=1 Tax=unclassified Sphingobacterium TaxID=2609468 RepID=UPI00038A403A|nr:MULTISPECIES: HlyD family efflux transporter periplasmic adaptor subunit [unclassified Sphingobacterium]KKX51829.1 hypothetical protein L950_0203330 [Sphingobacterium sp. IITKGP-BTPF85]NJI74084.1 HlyD family efflux transporter periplasmic adaptor subunit [Sphingobacterium sp. B16(2022)]